MLAQTKTRTRPAAEFVWPPPAEELDALQVIELRPPTSAEAKTSEPRPTLQLVPPPPSEVSVARVPAADTADHASLAPAPARTVAMPATARTSGTRRTLAMPWLPTMPRMRPSRVAALAASMLFATSVGFLLGARDARRSMADGYARLRESVVTVRERVDALLPASVPTTQATARPAPARPRDIDAPRAAATTSTLPESRALSSSPVAPLSIAPFAPLPIAALTPVVTTIAPPAPSTPLPEATPLAEIPNVVRNVGPALTAAPAATVSDETRVTQTLARYERAFDTLDARAATAFWPSVNVAALTRAFNSLKSQALTFDRCQVDVADSASIATASCTGSATLVRQVGRATPVTESLRWTFNLRRGGDGRDWVIETVQTTR